MKLKAHKQEQAVYLRPEGHCWKNIFFLFHKKTVRKFTISFIHNLFSSPRTGGLINYS